MGVEKSDIYIFCFFWGGVHEIIFFGRGGVGELPKNGAWKVYRFKRGLG